MTRNLKVMGLALVAMFAMSAVLASAASAQFTAEGAATLKVSGNAMQKFRPKAGGTAIECTTAATDNTAIAGTSASSITATPTYSNCESILGQPTEIDMNDCHYRFTMTPSSTTGEVHLECDTGKEITITIGSSGSLCIYHIPPQTIGEVHYENIGTGTTREITINPTVTGITSTRTGSVFCPAAGNEGSYEGHITVTGFNPGTGAHVGIFAS